MTLIYLTQTWNYRDAARQVIQIHCGKEIHIVRYFDLPEIGATIVIEGKTTKVIKKEHSLLNIDDNVCASTSTVLLTDVFVEEVT